MSGDSSGSAGGPVCDVILERAGHAVGDCFRHIEAARQVDSTTANAIADAIAFLRRPGRWTNAIGWQRTERMEERPRIDAALQKPLHQLFFYESQSGVDDRGHHPENVLNLWRFVIERDAREVAQAFRVPAENLALTRHQFIDPFQLRQAKSRLQAAHLVLPRYLGVVEHAVAGISPVIAQKLDALPRTCAVRARPPPFARG